MARNIVISSGSPLIGSPVFVTVTPETKSGVTFHRVIVKVTASSASSGITSQSDELSAPVITEGASIDVDISSAVRSVAESFVYSAHSSAGNKTYPVFAVHVETWDEWMENGVVNTNSHLHLGGSNTYYHFLLGAFTDFERLTAGLTKSVTTLTRKPATGEVIPSTGGLYVYPASFSYSLSTSAPSSLPTTTAVNITSLNANAVNSIGGRSVYVDGNTDNYYAFQFVNGYGVIESAFAYCLSDKDVAKKIKEYDVIAPMTFNKIDRHVTRKTNSRHQLKMSSGPVNMEWQEWWQEEFLNTDKAWMLYRGTWVPVSIVPDETTKGIYLSSEDIPTVEFTVKMDFDGL